MAGPTATTCSISKRTMRKERKGASPVPGPTITMGLDGSEGNLGRGRGVVYFVGARGGLHGF